MPNDSNYALSSDAALKVVPAPDFDFRPPVPRSYYPKIGLVGCGGISEYHLRAYQKMGLDVSALCNRHCEKMEDRRKAFFPDTDLYLDYNDLLAREDIKVVDITLHPEPRYAAIKAALEAGKHVLSQKPFVLSLDQGRELVELADSRNLKLAVNQNGRWAPYVRYVTQAVRAGLLGEVQSISIRLNWDHTWVKGTPLASIHHLILYDFAIHWIDMVRLFMGDRKELSVFAKTSRTRDQEISVPMMASISIAFENGLANLLFDGHSRIGPLEEITVVGSKGRIRCAGELCKAHDMILVTADGICYPQVDGEWFENGFQGTMGELLCAIEKDREPENSARGNLESLKLAFAATASADAGKEVVPGEARELGDSCKPKTT